MKIFILLFIQISCTVSANLLMKIGSRVDPETRHLLFGLVDWRIIAGLAVFGIGGVLYAIVLRYLHLNVAQSYAAAQFIAVIIASRLVLGEPIGNVQWLGILLISGGIATIGWSRV